MASYIPASYAGRDFATRTAAHDQLWSNDDCLSDAFTTSTARLSAKELKELFMKGREAETVTRKSGKTVQLKAIDPITDEEADKRVQEVLARRKKKKSQKAARPSGGVAGMTPAVLHAERALRQAKVEETTLIFREAQQDGNARTIASAKTAMLEAKRDLAQLAGAGNASGKKKKIHVKLPSKDDQDQLRDIVSEHAKKVRVALETANTHQEYTANLHAEFKRFAEAKLLFYKGLPESPNKAKKVDILKRTYDTLAAEPAVAVNPEDETKWQPEVFTEFKRIMMDYRRKVDRVREIETYTPKGRRDKRKELLKDRTDALSALMQANNISTKARPRRNVPAQRIVGG